MTNNVVEVRRVTKKYCRHLKKSLRYGVQDLVAEVTAQPARRPKLRPGEFFALRNISFDVREGECVALLGPNGAGKSTMMKLLNGLLKPNAGELRIRGQVGALIELGTGFNPQLSGRENVFVNGAILGLSRREIASRFDEILEFSELGDFIHAPLRTYSTGMRVRLGYSVAAHLRPTLLLLDEVLAVGDVGFRMKCFAHLAKLRDEGVAIILVSHAMGALSRVAQRAIVFGAGQLQFDGELEPGMAVYQDLVGTRGESLSPSAKGASREMLSVELLRESLQPCREAQSGETVILAIDIRTPEPIYQARVTVQIESPAHGVLMSTSSHESQQRLDVSPPGNRVHLVLERLPLLVGAYRFHVSLYGPENTDFLARVEAAATLRVTGPPLAPAGFGTRGAVALPHSWRIGEASGDSVSAGASSSLTRTSPADESN